MIGSIAYDHPGYKMENQACNSNHQTVRWSALVHSSFVLQHEQHGNPLRQLEKPFQTASVVSFRGLPPQIFQRRNVEKTSKTSRFWFQSVPTLWALPTKNHSIEFWPPMAMIFLFHSSGLENRPQWLRALFQCVIQWLYFIPQLGVAGFICCSMLPLQSYQSVHTESSHFWDDKGWLNTNNFRKTICFFGYHPNNNCFSGFSFHCGSQPPKPHLVSWRQSCGGA